MKEFNIFMYKETFEAVVISVESEKNSTTFRSASITSKYDLNTINNLTFIEAKQPPKMSFQMAITMILSIGVGIYLTNFTNIFSIFGFSATMNGAADGAVTGAVTAGVSVIIMLFSLFLSGQVGTLGMLSFTVEGRVINLRYDFKDLEEAKRFKRLLEENMKNSK